MFKKLINWFLVIIWLIVIFTFSTKDSIESDGQSKGLIENTVSGTITVTDNIGITDINPTEEDMSVIVENLNMPIRKCAHTLIFLILAVLVLNALETNKENFKRNIVITLVFCFLYACTDEIHQTFIDGRTGQFIDCVIDTLGASLGCCLFFMFLDYKLKIKTSIKQK